MARPSPHHPVSSLALFPEFWHFLKSCHSVFLFIGAAQDRYLRAYDSSTGKRLWQVRLPAGGNATPVTYTSAAGRQFVVIAVGGSSIFQTKCGD